MSLFPWGVQSLLNLIQVIIFLAKPDRFISTEKSPISVQAESLPLDSLSFLKFLTWSSFAIPLIAPFPESGT